MSSPSNPSIGSPDLSSVSRFEPSAASLSSSLTACLANQPSYCRIRSQHMIIFGFRI